MHGCFEIAERKLPHGHGCNIISSLGQLHLRQSVCLTL